MNGFDEFDVADRLRQRGWVSAACCLFCFALTAPRCPVCLACAGDKQDSVCL